MVASAISAAATRMVMMGRRRDAMATHTVECASIVSLLAVFLTSPLVRGDPAGLSSGQLMAFSAISAAWLPSESRKNAIHSSDAGVRWIT